MLIELRVGNIDLNFELDTGACHTLVSHLNFNKYFKNVTLIPTDKIVHVISGESVDIVGLARVPVTYKTLQDVLYFFVINSKIPFFPLLGRSWLDGLFPVWRKWFRCDSLDYFGSTDSFTQANLKTRYPSVFSMNLESAMKDFVDDLHFNGDDVVPRFYKAYPVPFGLKEKVKAELESKGRVGCVRRRFWYQFDIHLGQALW